MIKKLATIGNSYGVIIDRPLLREAGIGPHEKVELTVENGAVVVRSVARPGAVPSQRRKSAQVSSR
jgi:antitoxin component of MazEF toxin-antitoxin module